MAAEPKVTQPGTAFFENKIRPVLAERCFKCHSAKGGSKGGLQLDARTRLLKGGRSGAAAVPGKPEASLLIRAIRKADDDLQMPPGKDDRLTAEQVRDFAAWVKMGLPYLGAEGPVRPTLETTADLAAARRFWSLQPPTESPLPAVRQGEWARGPIDRFILSGLEAKGLKPSPPADRRTLLRRAAYDLTGLPPTPEEVEAFLADRSPDAFAAAVDRLLASPQYGVKWGRHWLDVARYGDTRWVGAGEDRRWPFAYTYRDWVIRVLNDDMPYNRFVTLQLAADQAPGARPDDRAALGFLTAGRWFTGNLHDVIDDQIDVVTRGLLGLTVQCARCHDHKYDPVSAKDYYSLYGLFAASRMPVEGTGISVELPEVGPRPVDAETEKDIRRLRGQQDDFLRTRQRAVRDEYRSPEKIIEYLAAAVPLVKKNDNDVRSYAKTRALNEPILFRWVRLLQRTVRDSHPVFGPLHAFAELPGPEFAAKAAGLADKEKSRKTVNRHVATLLTPVPTSPEELVRRYARLLSECDVPEPSPDADWEAVRQVLRGNDSPVQVPLGELGQFLSADEKDRFFAERRGLLARLVRLPERADRYLAFRHEAAPVEAEVTEFLAKRRAAVAAEVRSAPKIAEYLLAVRDVEADDARLDSIVNSRKLNELLLRRWVAFLQRGVDRDDPVFAAWREFAALPERDFAAGAATVTERLRRSPRHRIVAGAFAAAPASLRDVASRYGELIARFNRPAPATDSDEEVLRLVSAAPESPLCFEPDAALDYFTRKDLDELRGQENKLFRLYLDHPGSPPRAMLLRESPRGYAQKVFLRGNPNLPGEDSPGRFLAVLSRDGSEPFHKGKGRWELARAIADPANPLTARVLVNRVWQWHFGAGLVRTPSDFGNRGEPPSHPALLDWLARRVVTDGWSLKKLHRHILLSATYQQSSEDNPAGRAADAENRLLWRMNRRRLTFEEIRDSLLTAAGQLDETVDGRPTDLTAAGARRRTVFGTVDRITLPEFYRAFDFPSPDGHVAGRHETTTPQQALYMMNSAFVMDRAAALARRATARAGEAPAARVAAMHRYALGRNPGADELALGLQFLASAPPALDEPAPAGPWHYGHGGFDERSGRVVAFEPFPAFVNGQWRGGKQDVDPSLGRCSLNAHGGTAGRDGSLAAIRRWVAPRDGKVSVTAKLSAQAGSLQPHGDGVRGRIVSGRHGLLGTWLVHGTEEATDLAGVEVRQGDTLDFVADGRGRDTFAGFGWVPVVRMEGAAPAGKAPMVWDAARDFRGSPPAPKAYGIWERYAQVLLESNEFLFLD